MPCCWEVDVSLTNDAAGTALTLQFCLLESHSSVLLALPVRNILLISGLGLLVASFCLNCSQVNQNKMGAEYRE